MKIEIKSLYYKLFLLLMIGTLFQSYLKYINIALVLGCMLLTAIQFLQCHTIKKKSILILGAALLIIMAALVQTGSANYGYFKERGIYYFFFIIIAVRHFSYPNEMQSFFHTKGKFVDMIINIWNILVLISIFNPNYYKTLDETNGWGGAKYFFSYTDEGGARLGALCCMYITVVLIRYLQTQNKKYLFYYIVPTYTIMASGSRTYLIVYMCVLLLTYFNFAKDRRVFWLTIIPLVLIAIIVVFNSPMGEKFLATMDNGRVEIMGKYDAYTNGRIKPIIMCLDYWIHEPVMNKLFGSGYGVIETVIGTWSFNDFIELGITYGIIGLACYIWCVIQVLKSAFGKNIPKYISLLAVMVWFSIAMISLFFRTTSAMLCFMYLCCACQILSENRLTAVRRGKMAER